MPPVPDYVSHRDDVSEIGKLSGQVRAIAFAKDPATVAIAEGVPGRAGYVTLVNLETGALTTLHHAKDEMLAVAWSADAKRLNEKDAHGYRPASRCHE